MEELNREPLDHLQRVLKGARWTGHVAFGFLRHFLLGPSAFPEGFELVFLGTPVLSRQQERSPQVWLNHLSIEAQSSMSLLRMV
jgi:hypothetical protein